MAKPFWAVLVLVRGVGGPSLGSYAPFTLSRAELAEILDGGEPAVEILRRDLKTSSEGLLIRGDRAYILVDGDESEADEGECQVPASWVELP